MFIKILLTAVVGAALGHAQIILPAPIEPGEGKPAKMSASRYHYRDSADHAFDCGLVTGLANASLVLSAPALREDESGNSFRAMAGLHQSSQILMDVAFIDTGLKIRNPLAKTALGEIQETMRELTPKFPGRGTLENWKYFVGAQEALYGTINNRVTALRNEVCPQN